MNATLRRVRLTTVTVGKKSFTYTGCVSVALVIQHEMRMSCITLFLWPVWL